MVTYLEKSTTRSLGGFAQWSVLILPEPQELDMSTETDPQGNDEQERDRRPAVKARFEPDVFDRINKIRRDRGVEWSTVVLYGIVEIEEDIPAYHDRYRKEDPGED